jgi:anti-sigma B factor antagonist
MKYTWINNSEISELLIEGRILSAYESKQLIDEAKSNAVSGNKKLIINISKTDYINSEGLNILIKILTAYRSAGGEAIIFGENSKLEDLFILTKLNSIFSIFKKKEDAILHLKGEISPA